MKTLFIIIGILFLSIIALFFFVIFLKKQCDKHQLLLENMLVQNTDFDSIEIDENYYDLNLWSEEFND